MADLIIGCVKKIGECILTQWIQPPVKSHFDYWWCFDDNIKSLKDGIQNLSREACDINQKIEEARLHTQILRPGIVEWLKASTEKLEEARRILQDDNIPKAWNMTSRYSMGKRAKKTAEEIAELRNHGNFNTIADPRPPPAMGSPYHRPTMEFESRKSMETDIVDCLKKSTVGMIVICGMGGVGKTLMAERIGERVKEKNIFEEVVMITVSRTIDRPQIQNEIAAWLKLNFDDNIMSTRAAKLRTRLMDKKKKIIILDDVWDNFRSEDLRILGIPVEGDFEMCKVLLTSRYADPCKGIKNKKVFKLKILEEDEAWLLFKDKAGDCVECSTHLNRVAKYVAAECKRLPIALVTVGLGLRDITDIHTWKNSLSQLRKANPEDFSEVLRDVYNPLKLSYDFLESGRERSLFLLCCLFPEDFNISVEQLTWYSIGLGLFLGVNNIEEARNRTHTLVGKLQSRFLLIDVEKDGKKGLEVKMHDVIRDVAIYIGSIEKDGFLKSLTSIENSSDVNCNWMSVDISNEQTEVPVLSRFPKLRLLMLLKLSSNQFSDEFYDISHISFEGMEGLNVLSFEGISFRSLQPTLGSLANLQTLRLFRCQVENISVVGKLTSLKILICRECEYITELPAEIERLKGLRLLELNRCRKLQRIPFGIISSLFLLEELKIRLSFSGWETGGERRNASLTELERLPNLTFLEIEISDCTLSAQEIRLSQELVRYRIRIGVDEDEKGYDFENRYYEKEMNLKLPGAVGNWIQLLARTAESLSLKGDGSRNINLAEMENLKSLNFSHCSTVKKLVDTSYLYKNDSLCHLKFINITGCGNLRYLFSVSAARRCLLQLEGLKIDRCESMDQVFWIEGTVDNTYGCIEFPKLKELILWNLPNLTAFCRGLENIIFKFPNLKHLWIGGLPKLNSLSPLNSETDDDNTRFHLFCNSKDLSRLEILSVKNCESMEQVFWNEVRDDNTDSCIEFPKLKYLTLTDLPNLTAFCQGLENIIIKFPNLTYMDIEGLPKLNSLSPLDSETDDHNTRFHLFCNSKDDSFGNLGYIYIMECDNLRNLFSVSAARRCLLQLEFLCIEDCKAMEQVFWNEGTDDNTDGCIEFPKLKELTLKNLPNLTAFCRGLENIIFKFPNLRRMNIGGLPKLNGLSPLDSETVVRHDHNTCFHFVCNPKVEMGFLKNLELSKFDDNIKNIWCHQIPNNFFNNLKRLKINYMNGIRSLMSTSIAKNLVSLKYLCISDCEEMVEVIEIDDDNDKQVVDINCLFPNLRQLNLEHLHKLIRFWQWTHALELPLLEEMQILNCRYMETFTSGSINTPNIRKININNKQRDDEKDLNDVIRNIWTESKDESKADG